MVVKELAFDVGARVKISEIASFGTVRCISIGNKGIEYLVRYSGASEFLEVWFFENELEAR